ncbi:MAG: hypothetical protein ACE15B_19450 [Bryobacteraceae bacterium]
MAKRLIGLHLNEFSLVRGADVQPANQECTVSFYKAAVKESSMEKTQTQTPAPAPNLIQRAAKALMEAADALLGKTGKADTETERATTTEKATRTVESQSEYTSTSTSRTVENVEDAAAPAPPNQDMAMSTTKAAESEIAKALNGTREVILIMDQRLAKLEKQPVGSRVLKTFPSSVEVGSKEGAHFPEFTKFLGDVSRLSPGQKLTKATITTSGWTYGLSYAESGNFIDYIVDQSSVMKLCRTIAMKDKKQPIDKIGLGGTVLKKGTPGTDPGDTVSIAGPTQVVLDAEEVIAIVSIGDDTLEDNIEGEAFVQHLLGMIARAAANELEQAAIHGDKDVADTGILDRWDGWYKLAKANGAHVLDAMGDDNRYWPGPNANKVTRLIKALPTKYRQDPRTLALLLHPDLYLDFNDELAGKGASDAFAAITGIRELPARGVKNVQVPLLKTDMAFEAGGENYADGTVVMLTDVRNLLFGIHRNIKIEPQRWARKRCTDWVLTMRADAKIENGDAIAIYDHAAVKP